MQSIKFRYKKIINLFVVRISFHLLFSEIITCFLEMQWSVSQIPQHISPISGSLWWSAICDYKCQLCLKPVKNKMWLMVTKLYVWHEKHLGHVQSHYLKDITHKQMHPKEFYFFISVLLLAFLTVSKSNQKSQKD